MSFDKKQPIFTTTLTNGVLLINESDGVTAVSMLLTAGVGFYNGSKKIGAVASSNNNLAVGTPVNITVEQSKYIDSFTIDCTGGGVIEIIAR